MNTQNVAYSHDGVVSGKKKEWYTDTSYHTGDCDNVTVMLSNRCHKEHVLHDAVSMQRLGSGRPADPGSSLCLSGTGDAGVGALYSDNGPRRGLVEGLLLRGREHNSVNRDDHSTAHFP